MANKEGARVLAMCVINGQMCLLAHLSECCWEMCWGLGRQVSCAEGQCKSLEEARLMARHHISSILLLL